MSQQINLLDAGIRRPKFSFTSAAAMLYGIGIAVAAVALAAAYEGNRLRAVEARAQAVDQAYKDATAQREKLMAAQIQQKPNAALEAEVAALAAQLKSRQEVMASLTSGVVGNTGGFSEYLRAFSRQSVDGVWLTRFDIAGNELAIQGRALSADRVANFLRRLNNERVMQGRPLASVRISQPPPQADSQDARGQKTAIAAAPASPRYLDFDISTLESAASPQPAAQATAGRPPLLGAIDPSSTLDAARAAVRPETAR